MASVGREAASAVETPASLCIAWIAPQHALELVAPLLPGQAAEICAKQDRHVEDDNAKAGRNRFEPSRADMVPSKRPTVSSPSRTVPCQRFGSRSAGAGSSSPGSVSTVWWSVAPQRLIRGRTIAEETNALAR